MRGRIVIVLGLALACPSLVFGADPVTATPAVERTEIVEPGIAPTTELVNEKPKLVEKPKPVEKPRPVITTKDVRPPVVEPSQPKEPPANAAVAPEPAPEAAAMATQDKNTAGYSFSCLALAFAMLIIGVAAGFIGRHLMSRHKLGGMTVRIGTWRGIP